MLLEFMIFVDEKISQELFKFYYQIPHDMEMCRLFFQGSTEFQSGRHGSSFHFFVAAKTRKTWKSEII